ncbi:tRNA (guanosine(46)-N7)-methyltransferase TrmB [Alkaliphilus hydrothermalis]|uniref:tRNA (guanine-N(7)-)-methyltransferase n=1 Tax=Alkaliphilus hydrothermalis TaxID=1482730 RepID=A0ABS2NQL8_9FIRM|nr:tRNA (guanosine(46)-N7)-methyltransferase TrmB [Alkaliphilus hydrothermalis]MBM7615243.1 tRNA (guanine-N7-)-methyltransferase [Alkaliphilus hydrothermalis]
MRVRNIPGVDGLLKDSKYFVECQQNKKLKVKEIFPDQHPLHLEIGMGKGQFLTILAERNPKVNFIGIEKSKELLWKVCKSLEETSLTNIKVLHQRAEGLEEIFEANKIQRIYLNFSDPWPKARHYKRRLTHHSFLEQYKVILSEKGEIHFKTDGLELFNFSVEEFKQMQGLKLKEITYDLHKNPPMDNVMTEYEEKFVKAGKKICKLIAVVE